MNKPFKNLVCADHGKQKKKITFSFFHHKKTLLDVFVSSIEFLE